MDLFSPYILAAIKKSRTQKRRLDSDKIFKEVVKESATNITLEDIQHALQYIVNKGKLTNTPHKGLDSYCAVDTQLVDDTCCEHTEFQKNSAPVVFISLPLLTINCNAC